MKITKEDVYYASDRPQKFADLLNIGAKVAVVAGAASGAVALGDTPQAVVAVLAVVTATGAPATKFLLAATTDYTVSGSNITCVTNQSANTLIVLYR